MVLSASAELSTPDVLLPFPLPALVDGHAALRLRTADRALEHGLTGPRGAAKLRTSGLLDLPLMMVRGADPGRAAVLLDWFVWMTVLDDRVDNGPWARDGGLSALAAAAADLVAGQEVHPDADPMQRALVAELWPRTQRLGGPRWRDRVGRHLLEHLDSQQVLAGRRALPDPVPMTLAVYAPLRRALFGAGFFFELLHALDGAAPEQAPSAELALARVCAADVIAWTNDLYSLRKDLSLGEEANLVRVVAHAEHGESVRWQEMLELTHQMITERTVDFLRSAEAVAAPAELVLVDRLCETMAASAHWHRVSSRYHGRPAGAAPEPTSPQQPSLLAPGFELDPYRHYTLLRTEFPVAYDEPVDAWLVSRYEDVRTALSDARFTSASYGWQLAPMFGRTVMQMDGREHAAHRSFLTPAFRGHALERLTPSIEAVSAALVERIRQELVQGKVVDLATEFCQELPVRIVAHTLGLPERDVDRIRTWYQDGFSYLGNYRQDPAALAGGMQARDELYDYLDEHIAARRAHPGPDLLSVLCNAEIDGEPLPEDMIKGFCGTLLGAGGETTDTALRSHLANLLDHPDVLAAVREHPADHAEPAFLESLRRNPPVHIVLRETSAAVELSTGRIPAGATVACLIGSANRDPERFADPDDYRPSRLEHPLERHYTASAAHLAFGAGRHVCLGAQLARREVGIAVPALLRAVPGLRWAEGGRPPETGLLTRAPERVPVIG